MLRTQLTITALEKINPDLDYSLSVITNKTTMKTKITVICNEHGPFDISLYAHVKLKNGCQKCSWMSTGKINSGHRSISHQNYLSACQDAHGDTYDYSKTHYSGALGKIEVICNIHGSFFVRADRHKNGQGCQQCMVLIRSQQKMLTAEEWLYRSKKSHGENEYDYSQAVYAGTTKNVAIICAQHGVFEQNASHHMRGAKCPRCVGRESKIADRWLASLGIPLEREYYLSEIRRWADGYDPLSRTVYLFHGDYWHGNPQVFSSGQINKTIGKTHGELYEATLRAEKQILDAGYNLVTIWEQTFKAQSNPFDGPPEAARKEGLGLPQGHRRQRLE